MTDVKIDLERHKPYFSAKTVSGYRIARLVISEFTRACAQTTTLINAAYLNIFQILSKSPQLASLLCLGAF